MQVFDFFFMSCHRQISLVKKKFSCCCISFGTVMQWLSERNRALGVHGGLNQTKYCSNVWLECIDSNESGTTRPQNRERKRHPEAMTTTSASTTQRQDHQIMVNHLRDRILMETETSRVELYMYGEELHDTTGRVLLSSTATWTPMCMWMKCWHILLFLSCRTFSLKETVYCNRMVLGHIQLESHSS